MNPLDNYLRDIREHPLFPGLLKQLREQRPVLPEFDPQNDNAEEWKQKSGMGKGYDLCLALFKIDLGVKDD